ncbi:MAG: hypothetical protein RR202_03410 [Bacteroidales bacterium]
MIRIWKYYETPLLLVAFLNWLFLYAFSTGNVYEGFWWVVLFFSVITALFSALLAWGEKKRPMNFFTCLTVGKVMKFVFSTGFLMVCILLDPGQILNFSVTTALLFLVTLIVDTALVLRFARFLKIAARENT